MTCPWGGPGRAFGQPTALRLREALRRIARGVVLPAVLLAAACGAESTSTSQSVVRDSADVMIVENADPDWSDRPAWWVDSLPALSIGETENAAEPYLLDRVLDALRLQDGTIIVSNGGTLELRFFDSQGTHIRSIGGRGEGPGEFQSIRLGRLGPDSLVVWDEVQRRVTVLSHNGEFGREERHGFDGSPYGIGLLGDGSLLAADRFGASPGTHPPGVHPEGLTAFRLALDGQLDTIGQFPNGEMLVIQAAGVGSLSHVPFSPQAQWAVAGDRFFLGLPERYEIRAYRPDGSLVQIIRLAREREALTRAILDRDIEERLRGRTDPVQRRHFEELYENPSLPGTLPAYGPMKVDTEGNLWVEAHFQRWEERPPWTVFDPEGRVLARVENPGGLQIYEIGSDYLLGKTLDELGVERILLYRYQKR